MKVDSSTNTFPGQKPVFNKTQAGIPGLFYPMATINQNLSDYDASMIPDGIGMRIGIVTAEWNEAITSALAQGAFDTLVKHGVDPSDILTRRVPGSFELPFGAQVLLTTCEIDAVILLGCVIQGETRHFDFVCQGVTQGCMEVQLKYNRPVIFGLLTTDTQQQAADRAGGKHGNKGIEAAITAIKMVALQRSSQSLT